VAVVVVNTDPLAFTPAATRPADAAFARSPGGDWYFLTGQLDGLNRVWNAYGIAIEVLRATGSVSHNDAMYFIDPAGRLRFRATPYADESRSGAYSLSPVTERQWAAGIASQARALLGTAA
jgi:cytochrome oxidase Cu insertion factor (SCO1/SenC/PrrC family)